MLFSCKFKYFTICSCLWHWKEINYNSYPFSSIGKAFCPLAPFRIFFVLVSGIHFGKFSAIITSVCSLFCLCYSNFVHFSYLEIFSPFFIILFIIIIFLSITINLSLNLLILSSANHTYWRVHQRYSSFFLQYFWFLAFSIPLLIIPIYSCMHVTFCNSSLNTFIIVILNSLCDNSNMCCFWVWLWWFLFLFILCLLCFFHAL